MVKLLLYQYILFTPQDFQKRVKGRGEGDNPYRVGERQAKLKEENFWQEGSYKGDINLGKFSK